MRKRGLLFCFAWMAAALYVLLAPVSGDILRLHVLANSDSQADQAVKLRVRDALQEEFAGRWAGLESGKLAYAQAKEAEADIRACADRVLREAGADYSARVTVGLADFPARDYGDAVLLPAGRYYAVRVLLGEAEGKNWFCMLYPALCLGEKSEKPMKSWVYEKMPKRWQKTLARFWKGKKS